MVLNFDINTLSTKSATSNQILYKGVLPIKVVDDKIQLNYDNQLLQLDEDNNLTVNLNEIGSELTDKANTDLSNLTSVGLAKLNGLSGDKYGIKGDYATQYGILECPNGILSVNGMQITLKQGVVMQCAGQEAKTLVASDLKYTITSNTDIDVFYAGGTLLECGNVFYQEEEPEDGQYNYIAWWQPSLGKWQFKSNETGNVFRPIVACRVAHIHTDGTTITRVDYIGNRILDDEIFAEKKDLPSMNELLIDTNEEVVPLLTTATLTDVINKINEIIIALQNRGVLQ